MMKEPDNYDEQASQNTWLTANEAGKLLRRSGKTVIRMMEDGEFPGYKIGAAWQFRRRDIEIYIESRRFQGKKADQSDLKETKDAA
jgi:excisionase family DNA binding protein